MENLAEKLKTINDLNEIDNLYSIDSNELLLANIAKI